MTPTLLAALLGTFVAVALLSGAGAYVVLLRQAPGRKRLEAITVEARSVAAAAGPQGASALAERPGKLAAKMATFVPKSPGEMNRLRRRMMRAGYYNLGAALVFAFAELIVPVLIGLPLIILVPWPNGLIFGLFGAVVGFLLPSVALGRLIEQRRKAITNGLPDVLDLLIVCLEAGSSLDQAIVKATDELAIAYPALASELKLVTVETRAGKPRIEAFKNLEGRTKNEDIRALVSMLIQTDRFGTSISQALRTFAEVSRTKRRQRAEEAAAKIGVKLVFPLVLLLFPALYVVILGAAVIQIAKTFGGG
jgi:tight adherence protein C